ncbi:MAG: HEAT repeat domain-containing protein [Desulfomonilaceae bacterium]
MPPLIEALKDPHSKVRSAASEALGSFPKDDRALSALIEVVFDPDIEVRRSTVLSLGRMGQGDAGVEELIRQRLNDEDSLIRSNSIIALAMMGIYEESTIPKLTEALASPKEATAKAAGRALASIGPEKPELVLPLLIKALDDRESNAPKYALPALRKMKKTASSALPKIASMFSDADPATRSEILDTVSALDEKGDYSLPIFIKSLDSDDPIDRKEALIGLLKFRSNWRDFIVPLMRMLDDPDVENRLVVVGILKNIINDSDQAAGALISLTDDQDIRVKNSAISALSQSKNPSKEILLALGKTVNDKDHRVRIASIGSLRRLGMDTPDMIIPILSDALGNENYDPAKRLIKAALEELEMTKQGTSKKN